MPRGDGTGPMGRGPRGGRGIRSGGGIGIGTRIISGAGPEGYCICPQCGEKVPHQVGTPCYLINCPKCGAKMTRE